MFVNVCYIKSDKDRVQVFSSLKGEPSIQGCNVEVPEWLLVADYLIVREINDDYLKNLEDTLPSFFKKHLTPDSVITLHSVVNILGVAKCLQAVRNVLLYKYKCQVRIV